MEGVVMKSTGSWYHVYADGEEFQCRTRGKLRLKGYKVTNPIAVGDQVVFELDKTSDEQTGVITQILPRHNYIIRKSIHKTGHSHLIASNIDQAMIVATVAYPRTSLGFIDRFAVAAESFRIPVILVFNKIDILDEKGISYVDELIELYENIGVKCLKVSAIEEKGIAEVEAVLKNKRTLIAGHSGVGKSTLINKINPEINQKIGEVSEFAQKGTHTTTFAHMFELEDNTFIIDTPGIKEYGLVEMSDQELSDYFPEMRALIGQCKFHDCTHTHEPGCAVLDAVENGVIAPSRYISYLSILEDDDNRR